MKVLIFGNIGSGKTTIINKLKEVFPWEVNAIDDYRRRYGDGTKENELIAQNFFYEAIKKSENQIIECLGIGTVSEELHSILCQNDEKLLCVKIITSKNICLSRLEKRIWDIPFPKPIDKVIELVDRTEDRIKAGSIEALWGKRNNTTIITKENSNFENLNEIVCEIAEEVLFILNPFKSTNEIDSHD